MAGMRVALKEVKRHRMGRITSVGRVERGAEAAPEDTVTRDLKMARMHQAGMEVNDTTRRRAPSQVSSPIALSASRRACDGMGRVATAAAGLVLALACTVPVRGDIIHQITDLYGTGVDNGGSLIAQGASDPHYNITQVAFLTGTSGPDYPPSSDAQWLGAPKAYRIDQWAANNTSAPRPSQWVAPNGSTEAPVPPFTPSGQMVEAPVARFYAYQTTFTIPRADWLTAEISGDWIADNIGKGIFINGNLIPSLPSFSYSGANGSSFFTTGVNTLEFRVENLIENPGDFFNPTGLQVTINGAFFTTAVPEVDPSSATGVLAVVVGVLALVERRRLGGV